jgi:1-acyl-sn-glycerol-3-phosphate acyltransferase
MIHRLVAALARGLLALFYRRIEVVGLEHVPTSGPVVIVANHHNALVDPMLLLATIPRRIVPLAKAPLFRHPLVAPFLWLLGALPAFRRQDTAEGDRQARNAATIARAVEALRGDRAIMIFPEGVSQPEPALMPLRTGAARMVLAAEEGAERALGVTVLPVGLVFHEPGTFRTGWALVLIGAPVPTAGALARAASDRDAAVRELTDAIAATLRHLIVEAQDRETLRLLHLAEALWRQDAGKAGPPAVARAEWMRRVLRGSGYLADRAPGRVAALRRELEGFARDVEEAGLTAAEVGQVYPAAAVARYAVREGVPLLVGLPLALIGLVVHGFPYRLTGWIVRRLRADPDALATYKLAAGLIVYPLAWLAEAWLVGRVAGGWGLAAFALALLPTGLFALAWQERLARVRREARGFFSFVLDRDLHRRLAERRHALVGELRALAALVPDEVLSGRTRS